MAAEEEVASATKELSESLSDLQAMSRHGFWLLRGQIEGGARPRAPLPPGAAQRGALGEGQRAFGALRRSCGCSKRLKRGVGGGVSRANGGRWELPSAARGSRAPWRGRGPTSFEPRSAPTPSWRMRWRSRGANRAIRGIGRLETHFETLFF